LISGLCEENRADFDVILVLIYQPRAYPKFNLVAYVPGLSVADALFNIDWDATVRLLRQDSE